MTPEQVAAASKPLVLGLGAAFTRCPATLRRAGRLGIPGWAFHVAGRAGALGDVRAATVTAALGFVAPDAVADGWDAAARVLRPPEVAAAYLAECCRWGTEHLTAVTGVTRLAMLLHRVVDAADASAMPLFAAWRAMPPPADSPAARAAVGLLLLREHVVGACLLASRAAGLTPLEAMLTGPEGESAALACGWPPPYPPVGPLVRRRLWADAVTDRLMSVGFRALTPAEGVELLDLLTAAHTHVQGRAPS
ncbi:SCO6745 family protein [Micromonospora carbonacea]|uniref:SCO6745 family protein n=1 Tax=Micromonospora carbonacea TaxID=47853 RepID=UPI003D98337D